MRRDLRPLRFAAGFMVAAGCAAALVKAQITTSPAQDTAAARATYARAIEKVEGLRHLQSLLAIYEEGLGATTQAFDTLKRALQESQRQLAEATKAVASTSACLRTVSQRMQTSLATADRYRRSARESLKRTSEFSLAPASDASARLVRAGLVFRERFAEKQSFIDQVAATTIQKNSCATEIPVTDTRVSLMALEFADVVDATRALLHAVGVLEGSTGQIAEAASDARARGWLTRDAGVVIFPQTAGLSLLRDRVNSFDGLARLKLEDGHPSAVRDLSNYRDAVLRAIVEEDALRFLTLLAQNATATCGVAECPRLIQEARDQGSRVAASIQLAENELLRVRQAIQGNPGLGTLAREPAGWQDAQRSIEIAADITAIDVATVNGFVRRLTDGLKAPVASAFERALVERREAYRRVFGVPEPPEVAPPLPTPPPPAPPFPIPPAPPPPPPQIRRHAFEVLALRSKESPDYGAYTYVIFRLRELRIEYQALLTAIVASTPAADPDSPVAVKRRTNLFEIPGRSADPIPPEQSAAYASRIENYDWDRALSLLHTAQDGVLTSPRMLSQFQRSPGPFLLTVPVPLEQATGTTPLLLADLSGYPPAGYADVVNSYKQELVAAFPTTQAVWRPPWNQRVALGVLAIGVLVTGQNFVVLRP